VTSRLETSAYLLALGWLRGVGPRTVVNIARAFPDFEALSSARMGALEAALGTRAAGLLREGLAADWIVAWSKGQRTVEQHVARSIIPIPITDPGYPSLLRQIPDAPPVLYLQGREASLVTTRMVAVIGTRDATPLGLSVARRVAQRFAEVGYVIVSGLAKGIDTAAHEGGLAGGLTVAVLGTSIDKIYPAENKRLAARITETGALVSEYPMGYPSRGQSFVERDRIQAGMSIAVIPVQTGLKGGTQHTIRFAEEQHRLLLCPRPLATEQDAPAYDGIHQLISSGRARAFDADDYADLWNLLDARERALVDAARQPDGTDAANLPTSTSPKRKRRKKAPGHPPSDLVLFGDGAVVPERASSAPLAGGEWPQISAQGSPRPVDLNELLAALERVFDENAPHLDEHGLDDVLRELRARRFPGAR
jgi:DNA processing protein